VTGDGGSVDDPIAKAMGERIKERRDERGMSQSDLGRAIGTSQYQVSKYERGENRVPYDKLFPLIRALGVDANYLFSVAPMGLSSLAQNIAHEFDALPAGVPRNTIADALQRLLSAYQSMAGA